MVILRSHSHIWHLLLQYQCLLPHYLAFTSTTERSMAHRSGHWALRSSIFNLHGTNSSARANSCKGAKERVSSNNAGLVTFYGGFSRISQYTEVDIQRLLRLQIILRRREGNGGH